MLKKRKRTDKSRYQHQTTGDHCTCAAYIAEMMCLRNAENKNVGSLPYKFWSKKPWDWTFKRQLIAANKILKDCPEEVLVKAVVQHRLDIETKKDSLYHNLDIKKEATTRKRSYGKKSKFDKLRSIERGKEEED
jgi:hypothetical protein